MRKLCWAAAVSAVVVLAGCGQTATPPSSSADPGSPEPVKASEIDSFPLSDPDLESLGISYERQPVQNAVPDWGSIDQTDPCQQSEWVSGLQPFAAFRMVINRGPSNFQVTQTVALYQNPQGAQSTFKRYAELVAACKAKGGNEVYSSSSPSELAWSKPSQNEVGEYAGNISAWDVRATENLVIYVSVYRRHDGVALSAKLADRIAAKATLT